MSNQTTNVISFLLENGALRFGDFVLKSGDRSPFFVNLGAIRRADSLDRLSHFLAARIQSAFPNTTLLFGPAYKGIAMAAATALTHRQEYGSNLAFCFDRKESKGHGERGGFIGQPPTPEDRIVIVDDVISDGGTKRQAMASLRGEFGVDTTGVLVVLNRVRRRDLDSLDGLRLEALVTLPDLVEFLGQRNDPRSQSLLDFYEEK